MKKGTLLNMINKILWSDDKECYTLVIVDRLSPSGETTIQGGNIAGISKMGAILLKGGIQIPVHRVKKIVYKGETIFER